MLPWIAKGQSVCDKKDPTGAHLLKTTESKFVVKAFVSYHSPQGTKGIFNLCISKANHSSDVE